MKGYIPVNARDVIVGDEVLLLEVKQPGWYIVEDTDGETLFLLGDDGVDEQVDRDNIDGAQRWHQDIVMDTVEAELESTFDQFDPYDAIPFGDAQAYEDNQVFNDHEGDF
jgi:hypothetical protein